ISIEVTETLNLVAVFEEEMIVEPAEESSKPISPAVDTPKTGDTASAIAVSAVLLSSLTAALFLAVKRRKDEQE
ncbi:MAG: LPXTG cell wall anchor domain-containing protein, partial [Clostridia bacterium]|nr:LPXTG cell wall anchor domain-containing protein [Clostridia bacterium]